MNNQKRPLPSWLPVRLTSVKTSSSLSAEQLHLQKKEAWVKHRAAADVKLGLHGPGFPAEVASDLI